MPFKYVELTEVVRQYNELLSNLLNKARVGNIDDYAENLFKATFIH